MTVAVHDLGGDGPPLIVAHCTGHAGRMYEPLAAALHDDFHVWAVDAPAHGASGPPAGGDFAFTALAAEMEPALVGLGPAFWFGHSMGGTLQLLVALRRPEACRGMYLYEPATSFWSTDREKFVPAWVEHIRKRRDRWESRDAVRAHLGSRAPYSTYAPEVFDLFLAHCVREEGDGVVLCCDADSEANVYAGNDTRPEQFAGIDLPVTLASGHRREFPDLSPPAVAAVLPHARHVEYDDLGHFAPFEDPARIAADVRAAFHG